MIVFLLLVIIAILLFGAAAIFGAMRSVGAFALALLGLALVMGVVGKIPPWAWALPVVALIGATIWLMMVFRQADIDTEAARVAVAEQMAAERKRLGI